MTLPPPKGGEISLVVNTVLLLLLLLLLLFIYLSEKMNESVLYKTNPALKALGR